MFTKLVKQGVKSLEKQVKKGYKTVQKFSSNVTKRFENVDPKQIIGELQFPILSTTKEGLIKTELTDRLIVLSKLAYRLNKADNIQNAVKNDTHFLEKIQNCSLIDKQEGMNCIIDHSLQHIYFSFKGTSKGNTSDYLNNFYIFFKNNPNPKKWQAYEFIQKNLTQLNEINPIHKQYKIILTGHSLGGAIAEGLTLEMHDLITHAESFNSGTAPLRKGRSKISAYYFGKQILSKKIISHHMQYDPLSWGPVRGATRDSIKNSKIMPHSINNFLELIFNFKQQQQNNKNKCSICDKQLTQQEYKQYSQGTTLFCKQHSSKNCQICQQPIKDPNYTSLSYYNETYEKNIDIKIHSECWVCQFCGLPIEQNKPNQLQQQFLPPEQQIQTPYPQFQSPQQQRPQSENQTPYIQPQQQQQQYQQPPQTNNINQNNNYVITEGFIVHTLCQSQMENALEQDEQEINQMQQQQMQSEIM